MFDTTNVFALSQHGEGMSTTTKWELPLNPDCRVLWNPKDRVENLVILWAGNGDFDSFGIPNLIAANNGLRLVF